MGKIHPEDIIEVTENFSSGERTTECAFNDNGNPIGCLEPGQTLEVNGQTIFRRDLTKVTIDKKGHKTTEKDVLNLLEEQPCTDFGEKESRQKK